jgi:antitoxin HigA-1
LASPGTEAAISASRLARYFGLSEGFFLRLQTDHDIMQTRRTLGAELDRITPRAA